MLLLLYVDVDVAVLIAVVDVVDVVDVAATLIVVIVAVCMYFTVRYGLILIIPSVQKEII